MIRQLRPFYSPEELAEIYARQYDHTHWAEHVQRVSLTTHISRWMAGRVSAVTAADLSCGNGAIIGNLFLEPCNLILGDITPGKHLTHVGRIEDTIDKIDPVDLFLLNETLEHVENPRGLLEKVREKTSGLVLSTPVGEDDDANWEHYWGWDVEDIEGLLNIADFTVVNRTIFAPQMGGYTYQIWGCV